MAENTGKMSEKNLQENREKVVDATDPKGKWTFDGDVTEAFDDMLERSIPSYQQMRQLCFSLGCRFVRDKTAVIDLGCSRGEAMAPFVDRYGALVHHVGVEVSPPMLAAARERWRGMIDCGVVSIRDDDLRASYPPFKASLTLAVLTIQFTPIEHRQRIMRRAYEHLLPGGAMILVEKVMGSTAETDDILAAEYWKMKEANGYTKDQIDRKRLALEGVLVPVTAAWNEQLLASAGFRQVERFWQVLNFAGWVAVKD